MCKHVDHEVQVRGKLIAEFSLEKGERLECASILDPSQHLDVCNVNNLEVLQQFVQDDSCETTSSRASTLGTNIRKHHAFEEERLQLERAV
jgi:hypothetical protein